MSDDLTYGEHLAIARKAIELARAHLRAAIGLAPARQRRRLRYRLNLLGEARLEHHALAATTAAPVEDIARLMRQDDGRIAQ